MKYEIEVKARISDINSVKNKLEQMGCDFSEPLVQHDYIYNLKNIDIDMRHKTPVLRVRKQNEKTIFTVKQDRKGELDCIEKEIEVDNGAILQEIFIMLGYTKTVEVEKSRLKTKYNDYEICLDEVKGLGAFIEVEKLSSEYGDAVQKELFDFLQKIGIKSEDRVLVGYDTLIFQKENL